MQIQMINQLSLIEKELFSKAKNKKSLEEKGIQHMGHLIRHVALRGRPYNNRHPFDLEKIPSVVSGFRIELHIKDMMNALETAHELGVPVPLSSVILEIMQALKCDGKAKDDHGGIVQFYEMLAKTEVWKR